MSSGPDPLDRGGPDPLFQQVREHLLDLIRRQVYAPGQRLPSERVLARSLQVSRLTLRVALNSLAEQGVLQSSVGRGWFVAQPVSEPPGALQSFSSMVRAAGKTPSNRVLAKALRRVRAGEAEALDRPAGTRLVELSRLRLIDGRPAALEHARFVCADGAGLLREDLEHRSLYDLVERRGTTPTRAEFTISARSADDRAADLLEVAVGTALLVVDQVTFDQHDRPFELVEEIYRVDRYRFTGAMHIAGSGLGLEGLPRGPVLGDPA